ncbi:DUF1127 domain-containing protein [Trabulsiella odontotermitis]|uniref:DUF1127 domain-containing protein n=1 Tax=Trabulsiella odontotermitis TaxID=379893 RepID=UPI0024B6975E|nr:DUF1127 domain-containing protein [Trabulsiella odontotermitis]WHP31924.1 DUF1127 domain-containing protein [Trabulsiella odontotermitis]
MEFYENRPRAPFLGLTLIGKAIAKWWRIHKTRRALDRLSEAQLKDIGISRHDIS